jgi:hypothetical protein
MDSRYTLFIAHATVQAHRHLHALLEKHGAEPTPEILADAARFGSQHAMARFYPGLPRCPFPQNPIKDIVLVLRYQYEDDPEGLGFSLEECARQLAAKSGRDSDDSTRKVALGESTTRLSKLSSRPSVYQLKNPETPLPIKGDEDKIALGAGNAARGGLPPSQTDIRKTGAGVVFPWEKRR